MKLHEIWLRFQPTESQGLIRRSMGVNNYTNFTEATNPCDLCRIFSSRPAPHTSSDLSFKSDRSISLKRQVTGSQATCWPRAPSIFLYMWSYFTLFKYSTVDDRTCWAIISTYNIKPADDCHSISTNQKIGTGWLLTDNNLQAYCADFPRSGFPCAWSIDAMCTPNAKTIHVQRWLKTIALLKRS